MTKRFRILLAIWNSDPTYEMEHWDVKMALELFMHQPEGWERKEKTEFVCKLKKSLYGLKQAARNWGRFLRDIICDSFLFFSLFSDPCVFLAKKENNFCFVCTHVDDIFVLFSPASRDFRDGLWSRLQKHVEIENLGEVSWALHHSRS